jgi:hypothetical protein
MAERSLGLVNICGRNDAFSDLALRMLLVRKPMLLLQYLRQASGAVPMYLNWCTASVTA